MARCRCRTDSASDAGGSERSPAEFVDLVGLLPVICWPALLDADPDGKFSLVDGAGLPDTAGFLHACVLALLAFGISAKAGAMERTDDSDVMDTPF